MILNGSDGFKMIVYVYKQIPNRQ